MIVVNFPEGINKVTAPPLYQWDYGQKLKITGSGVQVCQVHFCDRTCDETVVRVAGVTDDATGIEVAIPDRLLENEYDINAFVYECAENSGQTLKHIIIPVIKRKRPEDFIDPVPESVQTQMEEMIANANSAISVIQEYYGATLTFGELYTLIQELVNEKIDGINEATEDYWNAVESLKIENKELKQIDAALSNKIIEVRDELKKELQKVDKYIPKPEYKPLEIDFTGINKIPDHEKTYSQQNYWTKAPWYLLSGKYEITVEIEEQYDHKGGIFACIGTKREGVGTVLGDNTGIFVCAHADPTITIEMRTDVEEVSSGNYPKFDYVRVLLNGTPRECKITKVCKIERG